MSQPTPEAVEEQLMTLYAGGDVLAFRRLFDRLAPWLRAFFRRSFSDFAIADDLTQATFLKLHGARATYQVGRPLKPWLFSIAASVRRDELRRRYHQPRPLDERALDEGAVHEGALDEGALDDDRMAADSALRSIAAPSTDDDSEAVRAAIRRLPASQRAVIQLHQYEGLTFEQIAQQLNATPGAVRVRASRAYEQLRVELRSLLNRSGAR